MKKMMMVIFILFLSLSIVAPLNASVSGLSKDYKIIKKGKKSGTPTMFKVLITDKGKTKVKVTLPLILVETILEDSDSLDIDCKNRKNIDFKKLYKALKKYGPMTIVEVEDGDESIKVWFE